MAVCPNPILLVCGGNSQRAAKEQQYSSHLIYLPLVDWTDVQVAQDRLGSDFVVHPLISSAVVGGSGNKRRRGAVRGHVWHFAYKNKMNIKTLVGRLLSDPPPLFAFVAMTKNKSSQPFVKQHVQTEVLLSRVCCREPWRKNKGRFTNRLWLPTETNHSKDCR